MCRCYKNNFRAYLITILNDLRYRDGEKLVPSDGVVIEEQRLTLKNATKKMSGQYVCSAANSEGDGFR